MNYIPHYSSYFTEGIYLFNVNHENTSTKYEICKWRRSSVFTVKFEQISHIVFPLLTLKK